MTFLNILRDERSECYSMMTEMAVSDYLALIQVAHQNQGGVAGQRAVLGTTTARRIRERMVTDLSHGAVLPPIVIGVVVDAAIFAELSEVTYSRWAHILASVPSDELSIIDGMQRTAAIMEAAEADVTVLERNIRVEFWVTESVRAMVYRMLVLNTGQVPWSLDRQISVVFASMNRELQERVPEIEKLITPDNPGRRVGAGQYRFDSIVEMYMAFTLRKTAVDTKEQVSDEFSRLDFVENLDDSRFQEQFYGVLRMLALLDRAFSSAQVSDPTHGLNGRGIFDRQPARVGYVVALGQEILGRPGAPKDAEERVEAFERLNQQHSELLDRLTGMSPPELEDFLRLDVLSEVLDRRVGQVGRYERAVFLEAFRVLVQDSFEVPTMEPCWRAN